MESDPRLIYIEQLLERILEMQRRMLDEMVRGRDVIIERRMTGDEMIRDAVKIMKENFSG